MIEKLVIDEIIRILRKNFEQNIFDEKVEFNFGDTENKKSEIIKDIVSIANATSNEPGYIFYGVDSKQTNPLLPKTIEFDGAKLVELVKGKVEPEITFSFYGVSHNHGKVGVLQIEPSLKKPHIIIKDYGKLREGQIVIRKGSSTSGIRHSDLLSIMYNLNNPYFISVIKQLQIPQKQMREYRLLLAQQKANEEYDQAYYDSEVKKILGI